MTNTAQALNGGVSSRFEIVRKLGEGGAGVVYEVHDTVTEERLALKAVRELGNTTTTAQ